MNRNRLSILLMSTIMLAVASCNQRQEQSVDIVRLDKVLAAFDSLDLESQIAVMDSLRPEIDAMFRVLGDEYVSLPTLESWCTGNVVHVFQPDVDSVYTDIKGIERQLGYILADAERDSLDLPNLHYATVVWGNPRPMVRVDSVMLIALNHYLGADYPGYDRWPSYRRAEKTPEMLPYDLASVLVATQWPMRCADTPTLLNWMLYEGALVHIRMQLVPGAKLSLALGYSDEQLRYVESRLSDIWQEMALNKLIYDTDPTTIDRYIAAAPNTPLLQSSTPGRVGRYVGYRIVRSYLASHPHVGLRDILSPGFYGDTRTLVESGFSGR